MSTISEQGDDQSLQKRIRQAVYDIRYKARKEEIDLRHAYSVYIGKSGLDQNGKEAVQNKLFGKPEEQAESNVLESADDNKYKVRATDKETGKTYIRFANRGKINKLRSKGSVELTGHGVPKGSKTSSTSQVKKAKGSQSLANLSSNQRTANKYKTAPTTKNVAASSSMLNKSGKMKEIARESHSNWRNDIEVVDEGALVAAAKGVEAAGGAVKKGVKAFNKADKAVTKATMNRVVKPAAKVAGRAAKAGVKTAGKVAGSVLKRAGRAVVGGVKGAVKGALSSEEVQLIADAAAIAPVKNKKIGGEKVDNSNLIKVYPNDESDPTIGNIKSSYKPVGQVVSEILSKEAYTVTAADKKGNTPAYQAYKAGKKNVKTGEPLYKAADHLKKEEFESETIDEAQTAYEKARKAAARRAADRNAARRSGKMGGRMERETYTNEAGVDMHYKGYRAKANEEFVDPFYKSVPDDVDDGTGRDMYTKWNNVKNRLRSMGLKMNYELEGNQLIEDAVEYFYEQGVSEEQLDLIVEEVGLDDFVEFVLDPHQTLVEERDAKKAAANAPSYEKVKAKVDAGDAARKAAGKGEYAKTAAAKRNYGDEEAPEGKPAKKAKSVTPPAKKAATKKKVTTAVKKVKSTQPTKTATKKDGLKDGLRSKITKFVKKGVERHKASVGKAKTEVKKIAKTASDTAKQHSQHRKDLVSGLKATKKEKKIAGGIGKAVKKAVVGEETVDEGKVKSAVGGAVGSAAGGVAGGLAGAAQGAAAGSVVPVVGTIAGGLAGAAVGSKAGSVAGGALGAGLGAKKGKRGKAALGGAVGSAVGGPVGAAAGGALAASHELEGKVICESNLVRQILEGKV
jgi:hypothetical protein